MDISNNNNYYSQQSCQAEIFRICVVFYWRDTQIPILLSCTHSHETYLLFIKKIAYIKSTMNPATNYTFLPNLYRLLWLYLITLIFLLLFFLCFPVITFIFATCYSFSCSYKNTFSNPRQLFDLCVPGLVKTNKPTTVRWSLSFLLTLKITWFHFGVNFSFARSISYMRN